MSTKEPLTKTNTLYNWKNTGYFLLLFYGDIHIVHSKYIFRYAHTEDCDEDFFSENWKAKFPHVDIAFVVRPLDAYTIENIGTIIPYAIRKQSHKICLFDTTQSTKLDLKEKYIVESVDLTRNDMEIDEATYSHIKSYSSPRSKNSKYTFIVKKSKRIRAPTEEAPTEEAHMVNIFENSKSPVKVGKDIVTLQKNPNSEKEDKIYEYLFLGVQFYNEEFVKKLAEATMESLKSSQARFNAWNDVLNDTETLEEQIRRKRKDTEFGKLIERHGELIKEDEAAKNVANLQAQYDKFSEDPLSYCIQLNTSSLPVVQLKISKRLFPSNNDWWDDFLDEAYEPKLEDLKKYDDERKKGGNSSKNKTKKRKSKRRSKKGKKTNRRKYNHTI